VEAREGEKKKTGGVHQLLWRRENRSKIERSRQLKPLFVWAEMQFEEGTRGASDSQYSVVKGLSGKGIWQQKVQRGRCSHTTPGKTQSPLVRQGKGIGTESGGAAAESFEKRSEWKGASSSVFSRREDFEAAKKKVMGGALRFPPTPIKALEGGEKSIKRGD